MNQEKSVSEELLELSQKLLDERANIERSNDDDDYDAGYKNGVSKGLDVALSMVHERLNGLLGRGELDG
ncbi:hypothetical protein [Sporosarcina sp. FSL K6-3457]|uniref:hypothetical protein n=1 Tax=Sporosarcina sp. FSL K6-3457 TaxID=2978204 RepID=UPI0030F8565B